MPTIPTQSPFTYPIPNSSASPSFTQDDTFMPNPSASPSFTQDDTFMPEPIQPMPTFTQPAVHTQTNPTGLSASGTVQRGLGKDAKGIQLFIHSVTLDEHVAVQRENKDAVRLEKKANIRVMTDIRRFLSQFRINAKGQTMIDINLKFFKEPFLLRVDQLEMEEMDLKWQMAMLSLRINKFEKKAGRKMNYNNQQPARFDRRKEFVPCKSKQHLFLDRSRNSFKLCVTAGGSDPAASRNRPAVNSAGRPNPAGWSKRPAPVSAGRPVSAGWLNPAARPYFRPSSVYFNNMYWPNLYDPMYMNKGRWGTAGDPSTDNDIGIVDSGCSRSMTGNKEKLDDFVQVKGGIVKFGGGDGRISGKGTIRTSKLDFENVYYVEELQHFNLFSVSQICDKKNKVLFTDTDCLVLTEEFQLPDESQVVLRIPRERDLYTFSISELQPEQNVTCLVAKASLDESTRWHRRMAHVNFKTINKLAKEGLVDGLPLKVFTNEHNCVACNKGKQHKASYKHISAVRLITETLQLLHMDLFGPTNIRSIDQKYYSLVVTDDFSRFTWTFFLGTKDETFYVLKEFIALIENQLNKKVKGIRCDNGTEFKNAKLIELCGEKGIKRDYSNPRTPQQNGVAERKNRTLIEAARTMLADSKLPTMFWTEAVSTACYVLNRVSITNPHNKTPYELISGKVPQIGHLKPFGCQVTILNTSDHLGKFEGKADEGYLVGYAPNSKAYRVYNLTNKRVEETMNLRFLEDKPNVQGIGHEWDPAGIDSVGGTSAGSDPAGGNPAGSFQPAGSYEPAGQGNPAVSTSVSADFIPVHADESTLPPGQPLGSSENTTRFLVPSDHLLWK
ncbi:putative ribonuclease H-like domain-containing protein [Tanacetum coccineum]|uniref:Ribonuclease H-like domain-containing protein n=1 Tax=Tanacetum coccineum TaxID=301880 RepID=A0ABQ5DT49_9ASTR